MNKTSSIVKAASSGVSAKCGNLMSWLKRNEIPVEKGTAAKISFVEKKDTLGLLSGCYLHCNEINIDLNLIS